MTGSMRKEGSYICALFIHDQLRQKIMAWTQICNRLNPMTLFMIMLCFGQLPRFVFDPTADNRRDILNIGLGCSPSQ